MGSVCVSALENLLVCKAAAVERARLAQYGSVHCGRDGGLLLHRQSCLPPTLLSCLAPCVLLLEQHILVARHRKGIFCNHPASHQAFGPSKDNGKGLVAPAEALVKVEAGCWIVDYPHLLGGTDSALGRPSPLVLAVLVRACLTPHQRLSHR